jgi:hypothetical protein
LCIITAFQDFSFEEIMDVARWFYEVHPTKNAIWDFRHGTGENVTTEQIKVIVEYVGKHAQESRKGGKTAYVADEPLEFGSLRMADMLIKMKDVPFQIEIFKSLDEAMEWIEKKE